MNVSADALRAKVDHLRFAVHAGTVSPADATTELKEVASPPVTEPVGHGGTLHMCPWHTCQATRITPDAVAGRH